MLETNRRKQNEVWKRIKKIDENVKGQIPTLTATH